MAKLTIAGDAVELATVAAERVTQLIVDAAAAHGSALVGLTGGTTPRGLYTAVADRRQPWRDRIPWPNVHLFWSDERHVPPDHPDSNYGMAKAALIDQVPVPAAHVHRIHGEIPDARAAAAQYERTLDDAESGFGRSFTGVQGVSRTFLFDVMLLGLGADAHIASLFPGSELLQQLTSRPRVAAVRAAHLDAWRITFTPATILDAQAIVVLVAGAQKAVAVHAALREPLDIKKYPAQLLRNAGDRVEWFVDRAGAARS